MGAGTGTYPPKPAGIPAGMGKSFNLDLRSWWVRIRHLAVMDLNAKPAGLQKPATDIIQSNLCHPHLHI